VSSAATGAGSKVTSTGLVQKRETSCPGRSSVTALDTLRKVPSNADPIRIFLLDDHEVVRRGVRELLEAEDDMEVVGEAGTAELALARIPPTQPHVAVLDVRLPDGNGVEVCREIRSRQPEVACIMLTSFSDDEALFQAVLAGASGYLLKQLRGNDIVDAVRRVASGQSLLEPALIERVRGRFRKEHEEDQRLARLTNQERRILELISEGLTNRQIGEKMHLAEKTVKNYVSNLLAKLGMERRTQAAVFAARLDTPSTRGPD
jgi:two-component system, NarL family, response regulator DevR